MTILSPKQDFLKDEKKSGKWQDIVASPLFKEAVEKSLLAYSLTLASERVEGTPLTLVGVRMQGAQEVLSVLMNLGAHGRVPRQEETIQNLEPV